MHVHVKSPGDCWPMCAGMAGGLLFENFIATNASRRALPALAKTCNQHKKRVCAPAEAAELVAAERVGFFCGMLALLGNRGRGANRQLFFFSLLVQARGLSRTGMEVTGDLQRCECMPATSHLRPGAGHVPQHRR